MPTIAALAGGVGAARMLGAMAAVVRPADTTAIVNTGDDVVLHGLHISPDIDTVTYTLAGAISQDRGWGLEDESWRVMESLERFGGPTWFSLGDRDLATHLYRTGRLTDGATLQQVTAEVAAAFEVDQTLLPMSNDRVETRVATADGEIGFQEYFVAKHHSVAVTDVRFRGAETARPTPGVVDAIANADLVLLCPSNPMVSIAPILAVDGIRQAVAQRRKDAVAVSPIVAGAALKGPADRMLRELGHEPSVVGIARLYAEIAATLIIDEADADLARAVEKEGMRCVVANTVMSDPERAARLGRVVVGTLSRSAS